MRLRQLDVPEDILRKHKPSELWVEQKYDGFKSMGSRGASGTKLYSRNGKDLTKKAPSITVKLDNLLPKNTTVLGEVIYVVKGDQRLGLVQSVLHSALPSRAIDQAKKLGGRLEFVIYDMLELNGKDISSKSLSFRRKALEGYIPSRGVVRSSKKYTWAKRKDAMRDSIKAGGEGIVVKVKSAPYIYRKAGESEPFGKWWKHKVPGIKSNTEDVILSGYAKREKRLAFKMYQFKDGKRTFVGYVSNLPRVTERSVQKMSDAGKGVIAEISHQERFPSGKFRHPGWIRLRPDKPLKSATMTRQKMATKNPTKRKDHNVYVVQEKGGAMYLYTFSSKDLVQPSASAMKYEMILADTGHKTRILHGDAALRKFLKKWGGSIARGRVRNQNPRNSKVKDALAAEATRFKKFNEFATAYWEECARGLYWVATDEKRFYIGEHERKQISDGTFTIMCSPALALEGKNEKRKYVAELDVTHLPASAIRIRRGSHGSKINIVGSAGSVKVTRVLDADKAMRAFLWQLSILPSSKEELRLVWESAWRKRKKEDEKAELRRRKEKEREDKRAETKRKKDAEATARLKKKKAKKAAKRKSSEEKAGAEARASAKRSSKIKTPKKTAKKTTKKTAKKTAKKAAKKTTKKTTKKGKWVRVPPETNPTKKVPASVNKPTC
jgi:hypothetical protein